MSLNIFSTHYAVELQKWSDDNVYSRGRRHVSPMTCPKQYLLFDIK